MFLRDETHGPMERQRFDRSTPWWSVHASRYAFAQRFVASRRVLDVACGTGYGLGILRQAGARVIGIDVSTAAALEARGGDPETRVLVADGARLPFCDRSFEVIVSFETIEHLQNRERFLEELCRVLRDEGLLILSTPNANHTRPVNGKPRNPFHRFEYTPQELLAALHQGFASAYLLGQSLDRRFVVPPFWDEQERLAGEGRRASVLLWRALHKLPRPWGDLGSNLLWGHSLIPAVEDYRFEEANLPLAPVLVALCRNPIRSGIRR
jgi:SAM-dependent methyltransferase